MERTNIQYNLRNGADITNSQVNSVFHGTESISYLGPKIQDIVPEETKHQKSSNSFKKSIKMWVPANCPCRLCKVFQDGVGFINPFTPRGHWCPITLNACNPQNISYFVVTSTYIETA